MDAMVSDITDVDQVIVGERVLTASHPLLHIGRVADVIDDWIQTEPNVRQPSLRISRRRNLAGRERTLARYGRCTIAAIQRRVAAQSGVWVESAVKTCDPRRSLREADVGTVAIVIGHEEDAISAAHHQLIPQPVRRADSGGKVLVLRVVQSAVVAAVEHKLARIALAYRGADRVYRIEVEVLLRVRPFPWSCLDFIAHTQVERELRTDLPVILQ